jgi:hypothetical protein
MMILRRTIAFLALCLAATGAHAAPMILCGHPFLHRQQERNALLPAPKPLSPQQLRRDRRASGFSIAAAPAPLKIGDRGRFWGLDFTRYDGNDHSIRHYRINAALKAITDSAYVYLEDGAPASDRSLRQLAQTFDGRIAPREHQYFGQPWTPGIDGDPHVTLLVMSIRSPGGATDPLGLSGVTIGGFFNDEDEYPIDDHHPYSNEREMVTLNANLDVSSSLVLEVLAHEYQHLIHWNADRSETVWVNEGLSMVAPTVAGVDPGPTSALGNAIMAFGLDYDNSLTQWGDRGQDGIIADYGAVGLFFTYLGEKYGGPDTFARIVHSREHGIEGVLDGLKEAGYPVAFAELFTRWAVANLADDVTVGDPPGSFGYTTSEVRNIRRSLAALNELLPDLVPRLFQPVAHVKSFPARGSASLRPQAAHYLELTGNGNLEIRFDGGGHPFEAFVLARGTDDHYQLFPLPLDAESRTGSVKVPGLGTSVATVYLIVTNVTDESGGAASYRYEARTE